MDRAIAVTGATGGLGGRVAARLADHGVPQRLLVRDAARAPDLPHAEVATFEGYDDPGGLRAALDGIDTLLLVSAAEHPDRVSLHRGAVDAAVAAGVARIVYTSFQGAAADCTFTFGRDHFHTEEHIKATGVAHTFLRDNLYVDFMPLLCGADGVIRGPAGDGRVAAVARDDIADVAVACSPARATKNQTYDLTGPEAFTPRRGGRGDRRARAGGSSRSRTRPSRRLRLTAPERRRRLRDRRLGLDLHRDRRGRLDTVSDCVERFLDRPPIGFADWLRANPESFRHLAHTE